MSSFEINESLLLFRNWSNSAVAVSVGASDGPIERAHHLVDGRRLRVQTARPGRSGPSVGVQEKQTQNELRETVTWAQVLLRQEDHHKDTGQKICVQICM